MLAANEFVGRSDQLGMAMSAKPDASQADLIIELGAIEVVYVSGEKGLPIPQQAPGAFSALEALLPTLKRKRFYGAVIDGQYRACVAIDDETRGLDLPCWVLPAGRYVVCKIANWERRRDEIGPTVATLRNRPDLDRARPIIEFYRSQADLRVLAPVC